MYRLFLAIRYLLTRPINLLGMGGITVSVWALVVVVSLFSGFLQVVERHVHEASADLGISGLPAGASLPALQQALLDDPAVESLAPRLLHHGLLHRPGHRPPTPPLPGRGALHGGDQPFLFVLGVDAKAEAEVTGLRRWLTQPTLGPDLVVADPGDPLRPIDGRPAVLLGRERMLREGLVRGDTVLLTSGRFRTDASGNRTLEQAPQLELVVAGAFKTDHGGFDGNTVFLALETLRTLLELPDSAVHELAVRTTPGADLEAVADRLERTVFRVLERGDQRGYGTVRTWREKNAGFLASVEHQRGLLKIVLVVILVVAAFLMLATLSMMVTEKTSDIGILTAMGGTPLGVTQVFLACGLVITLVGTAVGIGVGCVTAIYLEEIRQALLWAFGIDLFPLQVYNLDRVPCAIDPLWLLQVVGMAFGTGFLVSAVPAIRAARHDPLVSLRSV